MSGCLFLMTGPRVLVDAHKWSEYEIVSTEGDVVEL